jgi:hypothetical protein
MKIFMLVGLVPAAAFVAEGQDVLPYSSLDAYVRDVKANIIAIANRGSNAFVAPSADEVAQFGQAMQSLMTGDIKTALNSLNTLNYDLYILNDDSGRSYLVAQERSDGFHGQGTYVVDSNYVRNVAIEVPHPLWDTDTPEEGVAIFQALGARALLIAGTHRCANPGTASGCSGTTTACGGPSIPVRISDAPHFTGNFMYAAHDASLQLAPAPVSLNLHGNALEPYAIQISDGTRRFADETPLVNQLRNALNARVAGIAGSCNWQDDGLTAQNLCGTTNAQGRLSNGSSQPCTLSSTNPSGLFLHIEQHLNIRRAPGVLIDALQEVIPAP